MQSQQFIKFPNIELELELRLQPFKLLSSRDISSFLVLYFIILYYNVFCNLRFRLTRVERNYM